MALRNMGHQDKELRRSLDDVEKLRLYAKATTFEHHALEESLGKASSRSRYCEWKAREGSEKTTGAEKERDEAKEEAQVARLVAITVGDVRPKMEGDLARVEDALATAEGARAEAEEARRKAKSEVDRTSLLL